MKITPPPSLDYIEREFLPDADEITWIAKFRMKHGDVLLQNISRSCFKGLRPTDDEAQCALNVLSRPSDKCDWKAEILATWILGFAKPTPAFIEDAQQSVVKLASMDEPLYKRTFHQLHRSARFIIRSAILTGSLVTPLLLMLAWGGMYFTSACLGIIFGAAMGFVGGFLLTPIFFPVSSWLQHRQERQIQKAALHTLRRWSDPRFIGTAARAAVKANSAILLQIQETVTELLEKLTPEYYGVMPAGTTDNLSCALDATAKRIEERQWQPEKQASEVTFAKNLLYALERVGSGQAAKSVRDLVEQNCSQEVTEQAKRVLPLLIAREREETARTTLLRHSSTPVSADQMLRAARYTSAPDDAEILIRPVL